MRQYPNHFPIPAGQRKPLIKITCPKICIYFIIFNNPYKQQFTWMCTRSYILYIHLTNKHFLWIDLFLKPYAANCKRLTKTKLNVRCYRSNCKLWESLNVIIFAEFVYEIVYRAPLLFSCPSYTFATYFISASIFSWLDYLVTKFNLLFCVDNILYCE